MMVPLDVSFHSMERDEKLVWEIDARVAELEARCNSIIGCDVAIHGPDAPETDHGDRTSGLYDVRVVLALPCREIVVERGQHPDAKLETAVENAFQALRKPFEEWLTQRHLQEECR